jgi:hypothetical protein
VCEAQALQSTAEYCRLRVSSARFSGGEQAVLDVRGFAVSLRFESAVGLVIGFIDGGELKEAGSEGGAERV